MSDPVIRVENLSKQYRLGTVGTGTLAHDLNRWWCRLRGKPDPYLQVTQANDRAHKSDSEYVWALHDIDFEVKQGEVLGIIGRNGAGKSTLLKILSRITAPTEGSVKIRGRIASLLEVGTGFHPELTGRENIFLNGAILGMTKAEIRAKLDEIVDFSGCERYLDTPVKRYSSGMMVRLGFAVAAHLEPEILIVDEVLAVGDAEFQRKCLGKMQDVAEHGRTVLFVSHNMVSIRNLCPRCLLLDSGGLLQDGPTDGTVRAYLLASDTIEVTTYSPAQEPCGHAQLDSRVRLVTYRVVKDGSGPSISNGDAFGLEIQLEVLAGQRYSICIPVRRAGEVVCYLNSYHRADRLALEETGIYLIRFEVPKYLLNPGPHAFGLYVTDECGVHCHYIKLEEALRFEITDDDVRRNKRYAGPWPGLVSPIAEIHVARLTDFSSAGEAVVTAHDRFPVPPREDRTRDAK